MKAIVIGAGLGGLAAASALIQAGHEVEVHERAPELKEVGAGIGLWGNAVGALRAIGLADAVLARGEKMRRAEFLLASGKRLVSISAEEFERSGGDIIALVHRAELIEELARPLPAGCVRLDRSLIRYEQSATGGVTACFADSSTASGDVLIGADGLHSRVREQMLGLAAPRYSGYTCWRGVVHFPDERAVPPGYVGEVWGGPASGGGRDAKGTRFGITRIGGGRVYWWATLNAPPSLLHQGALDDAAKEILLRTHGGYCEPVPSLIRATDAARILRNDIYDRPPIRRWTDGPVLLIGDAAHPTTPNLGQGGCMALEDAALLGRVLSGARADDPGDLQTRLVQFARSRYAKTTRVVRESRFLGVVGQWESPVLCWGRNLVMSLVAQRSFALTTRRIGKFDA